MSDTVSAGRAGPPGKDAQPARGGSPSAVERLVLDAIRNIRYGTVEITIHDSQVVQIERSEKLRVNQGANP